MDDSKKKTILLKVILKNIVSRQPLLKKADNTQTFFK